MDWFLYGWLLGLGLASFLAPSIWMWVGLCLGSFCLFMEAIQSLPNHRLFLLGMSVGIFFGAWQLPMMAQHLSWSLWTVGHSRWPSIREQAPESPSWVAHGREWVHHRVQRAFPADEAALLLGMLYGEPGLSADDKRIMRTVGLLHLIAISGTNVTFILGGVIEILFFLGSSRRFAIVISASFLYGFLWFVGSSASIVRATLMGWMWICAPLFGRPAASRRWLLLSAVLQLLWQPTRLLFDAGFALSFLAMVGLCVSGSWQQFSEEPRRSWRRVIKDFWLMNIAVTLVTTPYLAWAFGRVSWLGLISNAIVAPVVPFVMTLGAAALIWPSAPWIVWPLRGCLAWILWTSRWIDVRFAWTVSVRSISFLAMGAIFLGQFLIHHWVVHNWTKKSPHESSDN